MRSHQALCCRPRHAHPAHERCCEDAACPQGEARSLTARDDALVCMSTIVAAARDAKNVARTRTMRTSLRDQTRSVRRRVDNKRAPVWSLWQWLPAQDKPCCTAEAAPASCKMRSRETQGAHAGHVAVLGKALQQLAQAGGRQVPCPQQACSLLQAMQPSQQLLGLLAQCPSEAAADTKAHIRAMLPTSAKRCSSLRRQVGDRCAACTPCTTAKPLPSASSSNAHPGLCTPCSIARICAQAASAGADESSSVLSQSAGQCARAAPPRSPCRLCRAQTHSRGSARHAAWPGSARTRCRSLSIPGCLHGVAHGGAVRLTHLQGTAPQA